MLVVLCSLSFFHATVRDQIDSSLFFCSTNSRPTIPEWVTGVRFHQKKYLAEIGLGLQGKGNVVHIGCFPTWQEAARAFDAVAKVARGA